MSITRIETEFSTYDIEISYLPMAIDEENTFYNFKYHIYPYSSKYKMIKFIEISDKSNNLLYDCDFTQAGIFWESHVITIKIIFAFDNLNPKKSTAVVILENGINSDITNNYVVQNVEGNTYKFVSAPTPNIISDKIINKRNEKFKFGGKSKKRKSRRRKGKSRRKKYKKY
jgi:hypothetical protein